MIATQLAFELSAALLEGVEAAPEVEEAATELEVLWDAIVEKLRGAVAEAWLVGAVFSMVCPTRGALDWPATWARIVELKVPLMLSILKKKNQRWEGEKVRYNWMLT